jgi:hypothetical protein
MELTAHNAIRPAERERTSPMTVLICVLLFIGWVGEWPLELDPIMYLGLWRSSFAVFAPMFAPVPGISLFPWQLLLLGLAPFCLSQSNALRRHAPEMDRAIFLSLACIVITLLWGLIRGGSAYFAYYQLWRFLAALLVAYMLMSAMRTRRDLVALGRTVTLAALIRATMCIYFYWTHVYGRIFPAPEFVTNHDDTIVWVVAILIVTLWALQKGGTKAWVVAALIVPYVVYAIVLNTRRIAWVELLMALPVLYILMGAGPMRSRINRWAMIAAPLVVIYIIAGLSSTSPVFSPVHALMTTGSNYDPSSLTRQEEARNLLHTLVDMGNPILGTGWGVPYDRLEHYWSNYNAGWILVLYTPHNAILGLAAFSGLVGIIGIWGVVPTGAYLAARGYRGSDDVVVRTAAMVAIGAIAAYSVHCYGDIGFESFQVSLVFGAALATAGKVASWREALPAAHAATARAGAGRQALQPRPTGRKPGTIAPRFGPSSPRSGSAADDAAGPKRTPPRRLSR